MRAGHPPGWCIHYRSPSGPKGERVTECAAGVSYDLWRRTPFAQRPCFLDREGKSKPGAVECAHLRRPTTQEMAENKAAEQINASAVLGVMAGVMDWTEDGRRTLECPICKGRLQVQRTSTPKGRNKMFVAAKCETDGCIQFLT